MQNEQHKKKKVFVAMSGGVDSSVAAALLKAQGYDVVGVTMCFSISHPDSKKPSCCGSEGIEDAKRVAQMLDIPHYVLDFASEINDFIIEDFVSEYISGRTPNPCVRCNQYLKFGTLLRKALSLGADYLATGHYAKIEYNSKMERNELKKAVDFSKDQSYFLYATDKEMLGQILFPLGGMKKEEVRDLARKYKLNIAEKPESQDICFVPDSGYKQFIKDRLGEDVFVPGDFVNHEGKVVGQHKGVINYTVGQRDKLGIALGYPAYVYKIDTETNKVYVGPEQCLYSQGFVAQKHNFLQHMGRNTIDVMVRIRYNAPEVEGRLSWVEDLIRVDFLNSQKAVTPGQSAVFYQDDRVLGGAIIDEAICSI